MTESRYPMPVGDLELALERLGAALEAVGPTRETEFLCKLALAMAARLPDVSALDAAIAEARRDLESP